MVVTHLYFTANEDQSRKASVFLAWSIAIIAVRVIPTATNITTVPSMWKNNITL